MENQITIETNGEVTTIDSAIFILFAEFLGYVSPLIEIAEDICDGKNKSEKQKKLIEVDAQVILKQMLKEYSKEYIKDYYNKLHSILFFQYSEKLVK